MFDKFEGDIFVKLLLARMDFALLMQAFCARVYSLTLFVPSSLSHVTPNTKTHSSHSWPTELYSDKTYRTVS